MNETNPIESNEELFYSIEAGLIRILQIRVEKVQMGEANEGWRRVLLHRMEGTSSIYVLRNPPKHSWSVNAHPVRPKARKMILSLIN